MRRLGKVLHISKRGSIILRTDKTPSAGSRSIVLDKKAREVGIIIDVFGPVKEPYVAVRPRRDFDPSKLVGQMLYLRKK
ncbi:MAG: Gar1/Naf1 family protein [Candidatus Thorarchaeota archaeon]